MTNNPSSGLTDLSNQQICVIGAGTMGAQIAQVAALNGYNVYLTDTSQTALEKAIENNYSQLQLRVRKGKISPVQAAKGFASVKITTSLEVAAAAASIVIEAIQEDLEAKKELFGQLDKICRPEAILASNSPTLLIGKLTEQVSRKDRVCNLHFFHPALVMQLVEVARGPETSDATIERATEFGQRLGKEVVDMPCEVFGFIANNPPFGELATTLQPGQVAQEWAESPSDLIKIGLSHPLGVFEPLEYTQGAVTRVIARPGLLKVKEVADPRDEPPRFLDELVYEKVIAQRRT